jgi:structural maintenance of chromosome 1
LWNIQETISSNSSDIKKANRELAKLRDELGQQEGTLNEAREEQAKARSEVMKKEKAIKKQEKVVEEKVCFGCYSTKRFLSFAQKPAVVAIDTQVQHHERKIQNTEKIIETIQRDAKKQQDTLERYQRDLTEVKKAANEAQSMSFLRILWRVLISFQRPNGRRHKRAWSFRKGTWKNTETCLCGGLLYNSGF